MEKFVFCHKKNEAFIKGTNNDENTEYVGVIQFKICDHDQNMLEIANIHRIYLKNLQILNYHKRQLFCNDVISGSFQILRFGPTFKHETPTCFPTLKNVDFCYILRDRFLITTEEDVIYISDKKFKKLQTSFKNLYNGSLIQDKEHPNDLYLYDGLRDCQVFKLNLFTEHPVSIPRKLLFIKDLFSRYDHSTRTISYFESLHKSDDHLMLSSIKVRTHHNSYLDMISSGNVEVHSTNDLIEYIKKNNPRDLLSYNIINRKHFFFEV